MIEKQVPATLFKFRQAIISANQCTLPYTFQNKDQQTRFKSNCKHTSQDPHRHLQTQCIPNRPSLNKTPVLALDDLHDKR